MQVPAFLGSEAVRLVAMAAMAAPFLVSGVLKLVDLPAAEAEVAGLGLRPPRVMALLVIVVQIGGGLLLFVPGIEWIGAGLLAGFTLVATLIAHAPWRGRVPMAFWEHAAIAGGLLLVAVLAARGGAG